MFEDTDTARNSSEDTEYQDDIGQKNTGIDWVVTAPAVALISAVVLWGLLAPENFSTVANNTLGVVVDNVGWLFTLAGTVFVFYIISIALSRFGSIRLGADNEEPEFSTVSWVAMMFAAGMGIGLLFYGTAEPLNYYRSGVPNRPDHEISSSFASTLFHWTLHPWSLYAIVGLAIAYSTFRLGKKQLLSSAFIPLLGEKRVEGIWGKIIDISAIFVTVFGTAASLGVGALQIGAGMDITGLVEDPGVGILVVVIVVLGLCFLLSAVSGTEKGIRYLSNTNMILAGLLALFVFIMGPTLVILNTIPTALGSYFDQFFEMAARTPASANGTAGEWLANNTIFYWAWWISWSPFVGMFIARISRGRTVREFVLVVLLIPAAVTVIWFSIFGGSAIHAEQVAVATGDSSHSIYGDGNAEEQLFALLSSFPGETLTSILAMILLGTFFITSADSASAVMGSMSQRGRLVASRPVVVVWGVFTALIAVVLLVTGGEEALNNLQAVTIIAASPFVIVIIALMFALYRALSDDPLYLDHKESRRHALEAARQRRHQKNVRRLSMQKEVGVNKKTKQKVKDSQ